MVTHTPSLPESPDGASDWLRLEKQLCFAIYSASLAMTRHYKPLLDPLGLTYPQYLVMLVLWAQEPVTVNELGKQVQLDSGTLTPLLKRLEASGLIVRQRDTVDERKVRISLTQAGQQLKVKAQTVPQTIACEVGLARQDIEDLRDTLHALGQRLR